MVSRIANQLYEQNIILQKELAEMNEKLESLENAIKHLTNVVGDVAYVLDSK